MSELAQQTLTGTETDIERTRPKTFVWCYECDEPILRSRRFDHPHPLGRPPSADGDGTDSDDEDEDDEPEPEPEPERVGSWYDVKLSYSVDFRFRIPAWSEHEAKDRAGDLVDYPNNCADMFKVHDRISEGSDIMSDDPEIPDGWDPYAGEPLWVVFDDDE